MSQTKLENLVDPEVMGAGISAKLPKKIRVIPFAKVNTDLQGVPGSTISVPKFAYIGDAEDVAEGVECGATTLQASATPAKVKKAMKSVEITDEAVLSGYGDPAGEAEKQLTMSIASKIDADAMEALADEEAEGRLIYNGVANEEAIGYSSIVKAIGLFEGEVNVEKVMFIHPNQETELRLDPNFISNDKYAGNVTITGEIGKIANTYIVVSKRVKSTDTYYLNPIIALNEADAEEDEPTALTIYVKREANVEVERHSSKRTTTISADEFYTVVVSDDSKVVLAKLLKEATGENEEEIIDAPGGDNT